ncbi:NUDIX domain-containing protein [Roseovarius salis]|uniref:NUDIX hydrolase n=1 Tax=Roseovarius salis TaxID=3376063 RepID=UPI0037C93BCF
MTDGLKAAWAGMVRPLLRRPPQLQVAALCCRESGEGTEVLMITSRGTGRWVMPKGWLMDGMDAAEAARQEAWEEAGVKSARVSPEVVGTYRYEKQLDDGYAAPVEVQVYRLDVEALSDIYPEARERARLWLSPRTAANRVDEPELKELLLRL